MRLIDADSLKYTRVRIFHGLNEDGTPLVGGWNAVVMSCAIREAPTITPDSLVKRGRWERSVESKLDSHTGEYWEEEYYNCLECDYASDWKSPYCPSCGALMGD